MKFVSFLMSYNTLNDTGLSHLYSRKEAQDMLSDLAVKKSMSPKDSSSSSTLSSTGRTSSPRKRRLTKTPSPDLDIGAGKYCTLKLSRIL